MFQDYFTDLANQALSGLGLADGASAAKTIGSQVKSQFGGGASDQPQQSNLAPSNLISASNPDSQDGVGNGFSLAGMGLPIILVGGVAAYFLMKR